jgi:hypothetical protein
MMIKSKVLNDGAWKEVLAKNKGVKDNGLLKTLADIKKLGDEDHDDAQAILDQIQKLAGQLKKSKEIAAAPAVGKFLAELTSAADTAVRDVAKAKGEADKKAKAELEAKKREEHKGGKEEEGEEESDDATELLTTKLVPLLRQVAKGQVMHTLVAKSGKQVVVMLSRKPISPSRRKLLADQLGGGSTKYYPGHCSLEGGATTFALKAEVAGMAKLIKAALLEQTGLRLNKVKCRGEDGDDNDEDEPTASGGEVPDGDGEDANDPSELVPGANVKTPSPTLAKAPLVWTGTRKILQARIDALKDVVQAQVADEGDDVIDEITVNLQKVDRILERLDQRLADSLARAGDSYGGERSAAMKESKAILAEYIRYVGDEPLIDHLDNNPFGVKVDLKATLSQSLTQVAKAIG